MENSRVAFGFWEFEKTPKKERKEFIEQLLK